MASSIAISPSPAPDPCHLPGVLLATDPAGDAVPQTAAVDILGAWVAEPDVVGGPDKLVWTMKVASLSTIPANTQWYIIWDFGTGPRRYVAAKSDNAGALSYEYGHVGPALGVPPSPDANRPFRDGAADSGAVDQVNGTFTITVSITFRVPIAVAFTTSTSSSARASRPATVSVSIATITVSSITISSITVSSIAISSRNGAELTAERIP